MDEKNEAEPSGASGGSIPWSQYDRETLATGVEAVSESMYMLGHLDQDLFLSVMTYAFLLGRGLDPATVAEVPDALELFLNETVKARKECAMSHLLVSGLMTTTLGKDGETRFNVGIGAKQLMANELQADGDTPKSLVQE